MSSGTVKAGDCETTNLDSNLLIVGRVKRRVDTPVRNRTFADGDPAGGRARMLQLAAMRVQYGTRYANIAEHPFMPPIARTMIAPRFAAWEARARR